MTANTTPAHADDDDDTVIAWRNNHPDWFELKPWQEFTEYQREFCRYAYLRTVEQPTTRSEK